MTHKHHAKKDLPGEAPVRGKRPVDECNAFVEIKYLGNSASRSKIPTAVVLPRAIHLMEVVRKDYLFGNVVPNFEQQQALNSAFTSFIILEMTPLEFPLDQ